MPQLFHRYRLGLPHDAVITDTIALVTAHAKGFKPNRIDRLRDTPLRLQVMALPSIAGFKQDGEIDISIEVQARPGLLNALFAAVAEAPRAERAGILYQFWGGAGELDAEFRWGDIMLGWYGGEGMSESLSVMMTGRTDTEYPQAERVERFTRAFASMEAGASVRTAVADNVLRITADPPVTIKCMSGEHGGANPMAIAVHGLSDPKRRFRSAVTCHETEHGAATYIRLFFSLPSETYESSRHRLQRHHADLGGEPWEVWLHGGPWRTTPYPAADEPAYAYQWTSRGEHQIDAVVVRAAGGPCLELLSTKRLAIPGAIDLGSIGFTIPTRSTR